MLSQIRTIVPKASRIPVDVFSSCPNKFKHAPCSVCDQLNDLNNKFEETSIVYRKLVAQREGLISALNEEHDMVGTKLPDELLSEIFTYFCFSPPYYSKRALTVLDYGDSFASRCLAGHLARNILAIRQVSRHWGNIALATPQLWVYIDLDVRFSNAMCTVHFLEEWLKRSKTLPIRIGLTFQMHFANVIDHEIFTLLAKKIVLHVAKHFQRCTELKFIGPNDFFSLFPTSQLSNLHSLQVNLPHELYKPFVLSCSPQILQVALSLNSFSKFSIGFGNLAIFKGGTLVAQEVFELLQKAVYLTSLSVHEILGNEDSDPFMENQTLEHRYLQTFQVEYRSAVPLSLLNYLTLPMIESLSVGVGFLHEPNSLSPLVDFLERSRPPLKILSVDCDFEFCGCHVYFMDVLQASPHLEQLSIHSPSLFSLFGEEPDIHPDDFPCNLRSLIVGAGPPLAPADWSSLVDFLSMMTDHTTLQSVKINCAFYDHEGELVKPDSIIDKNTFKNLTDILLLREAEFTIVDNYDVPIHRYFK